MVYSKLWLDRYFQLLLSLKIFVREIFIQYICNIKLVTSAAIFKSFGGIALPRISFLVFQDFTILLISAVLAVGSSKMLSSFKNSFVFNILECCSYSLIILWVWKITYTRCLVNCVSIMKYLLKSSATVSSFSVKVLLLFIVMELLEWAFLLERKGLTAFQNRVTYLVLT